MKHFFVMAALLLAATSCSNESEVTVSNAQTEKVVVPVRVHVGGLRAQTRAVQDVADYQDVTVLTLAFYSGDTEVLKKTQTRESLAKSETFGDFALSLPMGNYTMVVLAYGKGTDEELVLTSPTEARFTGEHTRETFTATQEVNITNTSAVNISATLNRIVAYLQVFSNDGRAANVTNIRMTFSAGGMTFNPTTGLAISNKGFSHTVSIKKEVGQATASGTYLFLASDEQTIDVTIETLDADGNILFTKTVRNVSFKRNRITKLTGSMYTNSAITTAFQMETAWLENYESSF